MKDLWHQKDPVDPGNQNTVNCAGCHGSGPLLPKGAIWDAAQKELRGLSQECAKTGGPKWLCQQGTPEWPAPDTNDTVPPPDGCGGKKCHAEGFIRRRGTDTTYCALLRATFLPGGAMSEEGNTFKSKADCEAWFKAMNCDDKDTAAFCAKAGVSDP
jgi:hypothetical protein